MTALSFTGMATVLSALLPLPFFDFELEGARDFPDCLKAKKF